MNAEPFHFAMLSHPGRVRNGNEDSCGANAQDGAFVVCDGMGGAAAGEVASRIATEEWLRVLHASDGAGQAFAKPAARLRAAVEAANRAVFEHSRSSPRLHGMGTTLVGLLFEPATCSLTLAHVGDSRCYRWREGILRQLTADHSLVEEQVRSGELTVLEAATHPMRNIITRAVGSQSTVDADILPVEARSGDLYLLASDGLTRELDDAAIARLLRGQLADKQLELTEQAALDQLCSSLVDAANAAGGGDNVTVLLLALP